MAILVKVLTVYGEERELYIRLNNTEVSNHGVKSTALFRGFLSKDAFDAGSHFMFEKQVEFNANVTGQIWMQAYAVLKEDIGGVDA